MLQEGHGGHINLAKTSKKTDKKKSKQLPVAKQKKGSEKGAAEVHSGRDRG